MKVEKSA
jgi:hypothetical protein